MSYLQSFSIDADGHSGFPFNIPAVKFARQVRLDERVTIDWKRQKHCCRTYGWNGTKRLKKDFFSGPRISPILMGIPGAMLYEIQEDDMRQVAYADTEHYRITKGFLENPGSYLRHLE